ncbi:hypothetical protein [Hymenobacter lapidiphilus]|uniref:Uncharacterized protein n=1 Tax=Hymenobacter lapidiphilus TaxID=2608003 RepID=A0A7Y7PLK8_9BACT|nr:hypothetical protein [Hymenobacter lapidiphilus]NVO30048.1 hypothetical protein [Hymenobacter lapidiphilus]
MLLICLAPLGAAAQQTAEQAGQAAQMNLNALATGIPAVLPYNKSEGLQGSPYLEPRWLMARLRTSRNNQLAPVAIKYDVLAQRLLMRPDAARTDSLQLDDRSVVGFELDAPATASIPARTRYFRRFSEAADREQQSEYVEVLHEGRHTLLKRYAKKFVPAKEPQAYSYGPRLDQIRNENQYFLLRPDKTLVPLKLTLKMLQAAAPELALKTVSGASKASTDAEWAAVLAAAEKE